MCVASIGYRSIFPSVPVALASLSLFSSTAYFHYLTLQTVKTDSEDFPKYHNQYKRPPTAHTARELHLCNLSILHEPDAPVVKLRKPAIIRRRNGAKYSSRCMFITTLKHKANKLKDKQYSPPWILTAYPSLLQGPEEMNAPVAQCLEMSRMRVTFSVSSDFMCGVSPCNNSPTAFNLDDSATAHCSRCRAEVRIYFMHDTQVRRQRPQKQFERP